jgi:hypothetical protein
LADSLFFYNSFFACVKETLAGSLKTKPDIFQLTETREQRIKRLTGFDNCKCPKCKTGTMQAIQTLPPIRSPVDVFYPRTSNLNL